MADLKTGQCVAGWHEGTRPKTRDDRPIQVCAMWRSCPCECHDSITRMYEMAEEERVWHDNPEYIKPESTYYMPVFGVDYGLTKKPLADGHVFTPGILEAPVPYGADPARGHRGSLELAVLDMCKGLELDLEAQYTTKFISKLIGEKLDISPPSTGAVQACFDRWEKIGFAFIGRKPVRFISFTPAGLADGLELTKAKAKR